MFSKLRLLLLALMLMSFAIAAGQVGESWNRLSLTPSSRQDEGVAITSDTAGNIYVAGNFLTYLDVYYQLRVAKYDPAGTLLWEQNVPLDGRGERDVPIGIRVNTAGDVYVAVRSNGEGSDADWALLKMTSSGVVGWVRRFNGAANGRDEPTALEVDSSGNALICGWAGGPPEVATLKKYSPAGTLLWTATNTGISGTGARFIGMKIDTRGNIDVCGLAYTGPTVLLAASYSSTGLQRWSQTYTAADGVTPIGIASDGSSRTTIVGNRNVSGQPHFVLVQYSLSGGLNWHYEYPAVGDPGLYSSDLVADPHGNLYVAATRYSLPTGGNEAKVLKFGSDGGIPAWIRTVANPSHGYQSSRKLRVDPQNNVYMSFIDAPAAYAMGLVKYDSSGNLKWSRTFGGGSVAFPRGFEVRANGDVHFTGMAYANDTNCFKSVVIKYVQAVFAHTDSYTTRVSTALHVAAPGVLENDAYTEGATAQLVSGVSHGTLSLHADGSFDYTPTTGYNGSDTFTYRGVKGSLNGNTVTVTIRMTLA